MNCGGGARNMRALILNRMPRTEKNAVWQMFSALAENVRFGASHYRQRGAGMSTLIYKLYEKYQTEGIAMPYTMQDFCRDFTKEHIHQLTPEERLQGLTPEEVLKSFKPEEVLKRFKPEELLEKFKLKERLQGFSAEEIKAYLAELEKK